MLDLDGDTVAAYCGYHPLPDDAEALVASHTFDRLLVVGPDVPDVGERVGEVRAKYADGPALPEGLYWLHRDVTSVVLVVNEGVAASAPVRVSVDQLESDHALGQVGQWFDALWPDAAVVPTALFAPGMEVLTYPDGRSALVRSRQFRNGSWVYRVTVSGQARQFFENSLRPQPEIEGPAEWVHQPTATARRFAATLTRAKLQGQLTDTFFSFRATKTIFRPYQFKPVMRLLEAEKLRILVADEVGLGKTIEAGLIWTEMEARGQANRVLVVCPSSLVAKWKQEMEERFSFELVELDAAGLAGILERLETDRFPQRCAYICSIERLRRWDGLSAASELRLQFDLAIVDEAHAFRNRETRSNALGLLISEWSDALVFLSATPLNLRNEDLYNTLELLVPGEFDDLASLEQRLEPNAVLHRIGASLFDETVSAAERTRLLDGILTMTFGPAIAGRPEFVRLRRTLSHCPLSSRDIAEAKRLLAALHALSAVVTRTRKVEIQEDKTLRVPQSVDVQWTPVERAFYEEYLVWCRARADLAGVPVGFAMQMPLRLASTCLPVARDQVLTWNTNDTDPIDEDAAGTDPADEHGRRPVAPAVWPHAELVARATELGHVDTKVGQLRRVIDDLRTQGKQVLVFTFSRPTIAYLHRQLKDAARIAVMHGGVPKAARHEIMAAFRRGEYDVLLANRVASEGLDFEFCSAVVNYDLPWNPMEVEQRIGRIDRIGQREEKVYVVNFHTPDTIEADIVLRVMERIGVFERSIGELEPIVTAQLPELQRTLFDFELTPVQRERKAMQVLTAIEEKSLAREDLEAATPYLMSSDNADIEGFEADLVARGRYVGQEELVVLLHDWIDSAGGGSLQVAADRRSMRLRGTPVMAEHVRALATAGERSRSEVEALALDLAHEAEVYLSLDQESARVGGLSLLTATHPLVRAALRVPGHRQARFTSLELPADGTAASGDYVVLMSVAQWNGLRPSSEIWTAVFDASGREAGPPALGDTVLASLASAALRDGGPPAADLSRAVRKAEGLLTDRQMYEEALRRSENAALLDTRRISLREVHQRKCAQILGRIDTLRGTDNWRMIPLFEAQLRREQQRQVDRERQVAEAAACALTLDPLAVCIVQVVA